MSTAEMASGLVTHDSGPVARTTAGAVRGLRAGSVHIWRSIPYAAPPSGPKRFSRPQPPHPRWSARQDRSHE